MKAKYICIALSLLVSLFIYLFYRTEKTVVNELAIRVVSLQSYSALKEAVTALLPLPKVVVYSLPEGLWVFSITLTSKSFYIPLPGRQKINGVFIPLVFCIGLEIAQLFHFTNGRFDFLDIWISLLFWMAALCVFNTADQQNILKPLNRRSIVCFVSYGIVYLSYVLH